jgi:hypothetical protein
LDTLIDPLRNWCARKVSLRATEQWNAAHQAAMRQKSGRIAAAGLTKEVTFEPVTDPINDRVDGAYRANTRAVRI